MFKKKNIVDISVLVVFILTLIDMDYGNLDPLNIVILVLIVLNTMLIAVRYIIKKKKSGA